MVLRPHGLDRARRVGAVPGAPDRPVIARSGLSGWAKKNQCHQAAAKRASVRSRCSTMGTQSSTARCVTASGWSSAVAQRHVAAAVVPDDGEPLVPEPPHQRDDVARPSPASSTAEWSAGGRRLGRTARTRAGRGRRRCARRRPAAGRPGARWCACADARAAGRPAARRRRTAPAARRRSRRPPAIPRSPRRSSRVHPARPQVRGRSISRLSTMTLRVWSTFGSSRMRSSARSSCFTSEASMCTSASACAGDGHRADHLGHPLEAAAQVLRRHGALAVELDVGLGLPAEDVGVDLGGEAADGAAGHQPVDPALHRRRGEARPRPRSRPASPARCAAGSRSPCSSIRSIGASYATKSPSEPSRCNIAPQRRNGYAIACRSPPE